MYLCGSSSSSSSSSSTFLRNLRVGDFGLLYAKEDGLRPFDQLCAVSCRQTGCHELRISVFEAHQERAVGP
jgi:hypothetical protein